MKSTTKFLLFPWMREGRSAGSISSQKNLTRYLLFFGGGAAGAGFVTVTCWAVLGLCFGCPCPFTAARVVGLIPLTTCFSFDISIFLLLRRRRSRLCWFCCGHLLGTDRPWFRLILLVKSFTLWVANFLNYFLRFLVHIFFSFLGRASGGFLTGAF